jgi:hypothetical protein
MLNNLTCHLFTKSRASRQAKGDKGVDSIYTDCLPQTAGMGNRSQVGLNKVFFTIATFVILFPKGGIKLYALPITWGYLLLFLISLFLIFTKKTYKINRGHFWTFIALIPFQVVSLSTFIFLGVESLGYTVSFLVSFFFLPVLFLCLSSSELEEIDWEIMQSFVRKALLFLACIGLFLFFYKILTGSLLNIPFLTTTFPDQLEDKFNDRGGLYKLTSTFGNGNIYGICLLMLLPFYLISEKSFWKVALVKASIICTTSRTAWIGLIVCEFLSHFFVKKEKRIRSFLWTLLLSVLAITTMYLFLSLYINFQLDLSSDNRLAQYGVLQDFKFFPSVPFDGILEVIYMGVLNNFGIIGLCAFCIAMLTPLILFFLQGTNSVENRSIAAGLIIYLFISFSDGAILLIPVMAIYWFLSAFLIANLKCKASLHLT